MLRIIPTPTDRKILYTIPGDWWKELEEYISGIYFEYFENEILRFRFFYALGKISVLEDPFTLDCSLEGIEALFHCSISLEELWEWLDQIPFKTLKSLEQDDPGIKGVWKMDELYRFRDKNNPLLFGYYEFQVSTAIIRSIPYNCWSDKIKIEVLNEKDKIYWITLCLLKFQRQLNQLSEE